MKRSGQQLEAAEVARKSKTAQEHATGSTEGSHRIREAGADQVSTPASRAADNEMAALKASCEARAMREELDGCPPKRRAESKTAVRKKTERKKANRAEAQTAWVSFAETVLVTVVSQLETFEIPEGNSLKAKRSWRKSEKEPWNG